MALYGLFREQEAAQKKQEILLKMRRHYKQAFTLVYTFTADKEYEYNCVPKALLEILYLMFSKC